MTTNVIDLNRYDYNDSANKLLLPQRDEQFERSSAARNNRIVKPTGKPYFSSSLAQSVGILESHIQDKSKEQE